jgi:hypothetical protein
VGDVDKRYSLVREAILKRQTIVAIYGGLRRELSPHAIGSMKGGKRALFYQTGGDTSRGPVVPHSEHNWRCLDLDRLEILEVRDGGWEGNDKRTGGNTCLEVTDLDNRDLPDRKAAE